MIPMRVNFNNGYMEFDLDEVAAFSVSPFKDDTAVEKTLCTVILKGGATLQIPFQRPEDAQNLVSSWRKKEEKPGAILLPQVRRA